MSQLFWCLSVRPVFVSVWSPRPSVTSRIGTDAPCARQPVQRTLTGMTTTTLQSSVHTRPPLSRAAQLAAGLSLAAGALLTAAPQYLEQQWAGDLDRRHQIAWGLAHQSFYRAEWAAAMLGSLLLLVGFLGLWQVTRWRTPRLSAVGAVVLMWGMSGQVLSEAATYAAQVVAADVFGPADAERLVADGYLHDPGMVVAVLVPVIAGMFFGVILMAVALWRAGFPPVPVVLLALWPLWDFFGPSRLGPLSSELFLAMAGVWLGITLTRIPADRWHGRDA
jgi:hypothetical protein